MYLLYILYLCIYLIYHLKSIEGRLPPGIISVFEFPRLRLDPRRAVKTSASSSKVWVFLLNLSALIIVSLRAPSCFILGMKHIGFILVCIVLRLIGLRSSWNFVPSLSNKHSSSLMKTHELGETDVIIRA